MRHTLFALVTLASCFLSACSPDAAPQSNEDISGGGDNEPTYQSQTLSHAGFDFSEGVVPSDWETSDGHTTNWPPTPTINVEKAYGPYVWFEPFSNTDTVNYTKDMGAVPLQSVIEVPSSWDAGAGLTLEPLTVGHVYVIKCRDGYAKLLVEAVYPSQDQEWSVDVQYAFTAGATFSE